MTANSTNELSLAWLPIAFVAPLLWAAITALDLYFVHGPYQDEWDGTLISGSFQLLPWVLVPLGLVGFTLPAHEVVLLALCGGATFLAAIFFYLRAMFRFADAAMIHIVWNAAVLVVPFFAWLWSGEKLEPIHYGGIALVFVGTSVFVARRGALREGFLRVVGPMIWAVLLMSVSMVLQKDAYRLAGDRFLNVFLVFCLGAGVATLGITAFNAKSTVERIRRFSSFKIPLLLMFVIAECMAVAGTLFSQRAIDLAPSPSFVAAVESCTPVFVMMFSLLIAQVLLFGRHRNFAPMFRQQLVDWPLKLMAVAILGGGIALITK